MDQKTVAALSERLSPHVELGNARRETLSLLTLGPISACADDEPERARLRADGARQHGLDLSAGCSGSSSTPIPGRTGRRLWSPGWRSSTGRGR